MIPARAARDEAVANTSWNFVGPYKKMTFASRMQHLIYWGPLKKPIEWSLKTVLAPWAYMASVLYHDTFDQVASLRPDEPLHAQDPQMLGDGRLGYAELLGQGVHVGVDLAEDGDDL